MSDRVRVAIAQFVDKAFDALEQTDYYCVLGVSSAATEDEIRDAYYRLASRLHPDVHGEGDDPAFRNRLTTVFSRVVEAYKILTDQTRRRDYDLSLSQGNLRLGAGMKVKVRIEESIVDANARKFYQLAQQAMDGGDPRSAVMNLRIAMSSEPNSPILRDALARAEEAVRGGGRRA